MDIISDDSRPGRGLGEVLSFPRPRATFNGMARHTLGLLLLLAVVFLWTLSNFLGSSVLADNTYAKPLFLTYFNSSALMLALTPTLLRSVAQAYRDGRLQSFFSKRRRRNINLTTVSADDSSSEAEAFLKPNQHSSSLSTLNTSRTRYLGFLPTARLALAFCMLWFSANFFAVACLQFTTVASATILTSTSSVWTLFIGAFTHTEKFTWRKFCGVLASIAGIMLISRADLSASSSDEAGSGIEGVQMITKWLRAIKPFPDKSASELALGDILALLSAFLYGVYTITLKKSSVRAATIQPPASELDMTFFFGLVGAFNFILLTPLFPILHFTGLERFELPPSRRIWTILLTNSLSSVLSDICWAHAMVLTTPLVVTVGLSLTIPLSLVGQMLVQGRYEGWLYWFGAAVVVGSFLFVDREEREEEEVISGNFDALQNGSAEINAEEGEVGEPSGLLVGRLDQNGEDDHFISRQPRENEGLLAGDNVLHK